MCLVSHGKWWICSLIINFNIPLPVLPVVSNILSRLSLTTSTILCKIESCMSLAGAGSLAALTAALFAVARAFDECVTRIILLAALG
jgi:hypothetical protein